MQGYEEKYVEKRRGEKKDNKFPVVSSEKAHPYSGRIASNSPFKPGLPQGDGRFGQIDRPDGEKHENCPFLEKKTLVMLPKTRF